MPRFGGGCIERSQALDESMLGTGEAEAAFTAKLAQIAWQKPKGDVPELLKERAA